MPTTTTRASSTLLAATIAALAISLPAQSPCTNPWVPSPGLPGVGGRVTDTLVFDPDGAGPLGERVLVAGRFVLAGDVTVSNLAVYDPVGHTWSAFGPGPYPQDLRLAQTTNGDIYVAGNFVSIAGLPIDRLARWDGNGWSALGSGVDGAVAAIEALPGGGLAVGGAFTNAGGIAAPNLAQWDGTSWSTIGTSPYAGAAIRALAAHPGGGLTVATTPSGTFNQLLAHFDGAAWSTIATNTFIVDMLVTPNDELYVAGSAVPGGSSSDHFARWTGSGWALLQGSSISNPMEMALLPGGQLAAVGRPTLNTEAIVELWDGYTWTTIGNTTSLYGSLSLLSSGELVLGGDFEMIDGVPARSFARWNGSWSQPGNGITGYVYYLTSRADGSLFAAWPGALHGTGCVLRYNGLSWDNIGGGTDGGPYSGDHAQCLFARANGELLLGGNATITGSSNNPILQRWAGAGRSWFTVATAASGTIDAMVEMPDGDLLVGGQFQAIDGVAVSNVARFDGQSWSAIGNGLPLQYAVKALAISPSGEPHAATAYGVFRWDGSHWHQLGLAVSGTPTALVFDHQGAPILSGRDFAPEVLRWNGTAWVGLVDTTGNGPGGDAQSLCVLPSGDVVAGPRLGTNDPTRPLQRWDGNSWSPLGGNIDSTVQAMTLARNGDLLLAGHFTFANGEPQPHFARIGTTCPAPVTALGANCFGSSAVQLRYHTAAWIGTTCRTEATTPPQNSLALIAMGTTPLSLPLASLTAIPSYQCHLLLAPDAMQLAVPASYILPIEFAVPDNPALIGANVRQQVISLSLAPSNGAIIEMRASNALEFRIGSF